jgi:putative redox protein
MNHDGGMRVSFPNKQGLTLQGRLHLPPGRIRTYAIFAPCFTCGKDVHAARRISQGLAERGIATLRLDFTGLGESEGDFSDTNFTSTVSDLLAAADFLIQNYEAPEIVIGHSLGGTAAIVAASELPSVKAVCTINSPCHPKPVAHQFKYSHEKILWSGEADVDIQGRSFVIKKHFLDDLNSYDMGAVFSKLKAALLVFHAPQDQIVHIRNASFIFELANHPKSFISLDSADHLIRDRRDADFIASSITAWSSRYLHFKAQDQTPAQEGQVTVIETDEGTFTNRIYTGPHILRADEPQEIAGGLGTGPSPYEYLLAALGACTSMTLRMYAQHKGWPLEQVIVHLNHHKVHGQDLQDCDVTSDMVDRIDRSIELEGPLTQEQKEKLISIAEKCPVHKTLMGPVCIQTRLYDEQES